MKKTLLGLLLIFFLSVLKSQTDTANDSSIKLENGWKFVTGDNLNYSRPEFDDSKWKSITVDKTWEKNGYVDYDGLAWYRIKVFIPSILIKNAKLKDEVFFKMGKIDDEDQVFLNGQLIGENGINAPNGQKADTDFGNPATSKWSIERRYSLSAGDPRILWDKENVIAVRVFDRGGGGGIYSGNLEITTPRLQDYLVFDYNREAFHFVADSIRKNLWFVNQSQKHGIRGQLNILVKNKINDETALDRSFEINLTQEQTQELAYAMKRQTQSSYVQYTFKFFEDETPLVVTEATPYILTPSADEKPALNGTKVYGQRPGRPFLFRIPATGKRPLKFSSDNLPKGLTLDENSGIIIGRGEQAGEYMVHLKAENEKGNAERNFKIVIGDKIALTPPMGWNSWNCWGLNIAQDRVLAAANAFIDKGLADHGWNFINIDDGWEIQSKQQQPKRDKDGNIIINEKFSDMKKLGNEIHSLGLKFGIYSSPGETTCGGYTASYGFEKNDAQSYANWGIDYLKYDWCSYADIAKDNSLPELMKPYQVMRKELDNIDRDIVYSLCQYGMGNVWEWGDKVGGNLWRTTGDITDTWESLKKIGFDQVDDAPYSKPGHWNDPDMLIVGWLGWGDNPHPTRLTPDEQYTHISLWSLLSAPLLIGCDLEKLDEFTLNLLTNDEVLDIDQDPLGYQARRLVNTDSIQVWVKKLQDGHRAIGIFNLSDHTVNYDLNLGEIGFQSSVTLRNLWTQKDIGKFQKSYNSIIPSHGVELLKAK